MVFTKVKDRERMNDEHKGREGWRRTRRVGSEREALGEKPLANQSEKREVEPEGPSFFLALTSAYSS